MNTSNPIKFKFKKLVRNNINKLLEGQKNDPNSGLIDYNLYVIDLESHNKILIILKKKLLEEVKELKMSINNFKRMLDDLSDVFEIFSELINKYEISYGDFKEMNYIENAFVVDNDRYTQLISTDVEEKKTCTSEQYKNHIINYLRYICSKKLLNNDKLNIKKNSLIEFGNAFFFLLKETILSIMF